MLDSNTAQGFTLMELIVTIAIIGMFVFPILFGIRQTGQTQNIRSSVSVISDDLQIAKVSSREARDKKSWGVISTSANTYSLVKGSKGAFSTTNTKSLQNGVSFKAQFEIWFEIGTGNTPSAQKIEITNGLNQTYEITINEVGTISARKI